MLLGSGSRLQPSVALATAEAEFMALTMIITSMVWFSSLLMELGIEVELPILIFCDNKSAICIAKTATVNFKYSKHIDVRQMYCREISLTKMVVVLWMSFIAKVKVTFRTL
jgi:hypothetical protein